MISNEYLKMISSVLRNDLLESGRDLTHCAVNFTSLILIEGSPQSRQSQAGDCNCNYSTGIIYFPGWAGL